METMKWVHALMRIGFGVAILAALFYTVGIKEVINHLGQANVLVVVLAVTFFGLGMLIGAGNFMMLAWPVNNKIRYLEFVRIFSLSWAISLFLPSRIGELSLIYY